MDRHCWNDVDGQGDVLGMATMEGTGSVQISALVTANVDGTALGRLVGIGGRAENLVP